MKLLKLAIWVFVAGISLFAAIGIFFSAASVERGGGPGAPLEGAAVAIGLVLALVAGGVFVCCIIFRPRELTESPPRLAIAIVLALGIAVSLRVALYRTGLFDMRVIVLDSAGHPLPDVKVSWDGFQLGRGLGNNNSVARGSGLTGSDGSISFTAHHPHRIDLMLAFSETNKASVMIEHCGPTYGHVVTPDHRVEVRSVTPFQMHFDRIMLPNTGDITLEIKKR